MLKVNSSIIHRIPKTTARILEDKKRFKGLKRSKVQRFQRFKKPGELESHVNAQDNQKYFNKSNFLKRVSCSEKNFN